jgi:hypothetical protein
MKEKPIIFSAPMVRAILDNRKFQTRRIVKPKQLALIHSVVALPGGEFHQAFMDGKFIVSATGAQGHESVAMRSPYGQPGDRLWVKETWRYLQEPGTNVESGSDSGGGSRNARRRVIYRADEFRPCVTDENNSSGKVLENSAVSWRSSLFMPRSASRILLEVTAVRIEHLQDISLADAIAEGMSGDENKPESCSEAPKSSRTNGSAKAVANAETANQPLRGPIERYRELFEILNGPGAWEANPLVWVVDFVPIRAGFAGQDTAIAP